MRRARCSPGPGFLTAGTLKLALCMLQLVVATAAAADVRFSAAVDRTEVAVGEQFTLTVTVEGSGTGDIPAPRLPQLDGFENLGSTRSSSTNISMVNGRVSQSVSYDFIYFLAATREGALTIEPCRITIDGAEYTTRPIAVTVSSAAAGRRQQARPRATQPRVFDPFSFFDAPQQRGPTGDVADNVDLAATVDRTSVWQGEQLNVTYTFYTAEEIRTLSLNQAPALSGFWAENVYEPSQLEYRTETRRGRRFYAATVRRAALFPARSGELAVDQMTLSGSVLRGGGFFGFEEVPFQVSSEPVRVTVRPLPDSGRPGDFCGGVGDFRVSAALNRDTSVGGEPLNLTITVTGAGNIGLLAAPAQPELPGVKALSPETRDDISRAGGRVSGSRNFIYPLIPQADGRYVLPERGISFFNPKSAQYYTLAIPRLEFVATGTPTAGSLEREQGVRVLGSDIAHIRTSPGPAGAGWALPWWNWLFYPAGAVFVFAGIVLGRHRRRLEQDRGYARRTRSSRLVKQRLKDARRHLAQGRLAEFYSALSQAAVGFVGDRFNVEAGGMTREQLLAALTARGVAADALAHFTELVGQCDVARFSPGMAGCEPQELLRRAQAMLEKL